MRLKDSETIEEDDPEAQVIMFPNPEEDDMFPHIDDMEEAEKMYLDAKWLKTRLGDNTSELVGDFISAIRTLDNGRDAEELYNFVDKITEDE
jgi:hypothetical protein